MTKLDLTANGRLEVHPYVNERKLGRMSEMIEGAGMGGFAAERARTDLKETLSTSDAAFSLAHLANLRNLPDFDEAPRQWTLIANTETVDDFKPTTFYSLRQTLGDNLEYGKDTDGQHVSPRVAELDTYQYTFGYEEESIKVAIEKRGFKYGISLEEIINDPSRRIRTVPRDMLDIALDTDEFLVFRALQDGADAAHDLTGGVDPVTGDTVPANAEVSAAAIRYALGEIARRTLNGRRVTLANQYYVVVPLGTKESLEADLARERSIIQVVNGNITYGPTPQGNLSRLAGVIESEWVTDDGRWYLVPAAGSTRRIGLVKLELAGRTAPEILVNNFTGSSLGGGSVDPFVAAHFDNDSVDLKLRQFTNSALVTQDQLIWSTGAGGPVVPAA